MKRPLANIRVIDVSKLEIGAMTTQMLGDLGADVIKIEPLRGEEIREYLPRLGADSAFVVASYRNKRSAAIDLKTDGGREIVQALVRTADIFVEVSRPGVMQRLGLDYETLQAINPKLVYCSLLAFGIAGPYSMQNSHSPDIDYYAGVAEVVVDSDDGLRMTELKNVSALAGANTAASGILAALVGATMHGEGSYVEVSMWDAAVAWDAIRATMVLNDTWFPGGDGLGTRETPKHAAYRTSDGRTLVISAIEPRYWANFCRAIGQPGMGGLIATDEGATDFGGDFPGLYDRVASMVALRTGDEWEELLARSDVPFAIAQSRLEALTSRQATERDLVWTVRDSEQTRFRTVGRPFLLDGDRGTVDRPIPAVGEHTNEVLRELGLPETEISSLRENGIVA
jgi:alpha-methylacyl-CoA racemase